MNCAYCGEVGWKHMLEAVRCHRETWDEVQSYVSSQRCRPVDTETWETMRMVAHSQLGFYVLKGGGIIGCSMPTGQWLKVQLTLQQQGRLHPARAKRVLAILQHTGIPSFTKAWEKLDPRIEVVYCKQLGKGREVPKWKLIDLCLEEDEEWEDMWTRLRPEEQYMLSFMQVNRENSTPWDARCSIIEALLGNAKARLSHSNGWWTGCLCSER